jgi:ABC-type protease/lipase transport system fused ATPase/permease subunit
VDHTTVESPSQALRLGRRILVVAFVLSFVVNILRLSGPLFMILIYDRVLPARSEETLIALFAIVTAFLTAQGVIDYARRRILARFGAQFQERLEVSLFANAGHGDLFEAGRTKPVAGLDQVDGLRAFFHSSSLIAIFDFFWAPMFVVVVFVFDPLLGWVCLGGMTLILCLVLTRMAFIGTRETEATAASRGISDLKTMMAASRDTIRSQDMARGFTDRWLAARRQSRDKAIALKDWTVWFDSFCDVTVRLTRYSVLAVGAWLTLVGSLTIGAMVAATFLVTRVLLPVEKFLTELPRIAEAWRNWQQLKRVIGARAAERAGTYAEQDGNPRARLSLVNVAARSPLTGDPILKGITFDIAPGQIVQITGMTGSGKTVLAQTIMGLWRRSGGTILVNGQNLSRVSDTDTDGLFGYLPESPGFISGTLADNIAHLDPRAEPARVAAAARKACLHAIINALPDGYQTMIDPVGSTLSRGQRHQLALARAVYQMPALLVMDEPDAMLFELIPKTMDKTFQQLLDKGGSILILARKPLAIKQIAASYQIEDGRLKPLKAAAANTAATNNAPAAKIAVIGDKVAKDRASPDASVTKLIRS